MFRFAEEYNRDFNNLLLNNARSTGNSEIAQILYEYITDVFEYTDKIAEYADELEERIYNQEKLIRKLLKDNKRFQKQLDDNSKKIKNLSSEVKILYISNDKDK